MATEIQYTVFKSLYDEEGARYVNLAGRAQLYFGIISLYLGATAFKIGDIHGVHGTQRLLLIVIGALFLASMLATVLAIAIRDYEGAVDPQDIINEYTATPPEDSDFLDRRIAELAVATNINHRHNNQSAALLAVSLYLLFAGAAIYLCIFTMGIAFS